MTKWDKIRSRCQVRELCNCKQNFLCCHPDNINCDLCEKEICSVLRKGTRNA